MCLNAFGGLRVASALKSVYENVRPMIHTSIVVANDVRGRAPAGGFFYLVRVLPCLMTFKKRKNKNIKSERFEDGVPLNRAWDTCVHGVWFEMDNRVLYMVWGSQQLYHFP